MGSFRMGPGSGPGKDEVLVVLMVSDTLAGEPFGVTLVEENEQVEPAGRLVQLRLTCWLKPLSGVTIAV